MNLPERKHFVLTYWFKALYIFYATFICETFVIVRRCDIKKVIYIRYKGLINQWAGCWNFLNALSTVQGFPTAPIAVITIDQTQKITKRNEKYGRSLRWSIISKKSSPTTWEVIRRETKGERMKGERKGGVEREVRGYAIGFTKWLKLADWK